MSDANDISTRLTQWDSRLNCSAPLSETQKQSVVEMNTYTKRDFPKKFARQRLPSESSSFFEEDDLTMHLASFDLGTRKVENAQQFFSWFSQVQAEKEREQESQYRSHYDELQAYCIKCDVIMKELEKVLRHFDLLQKQHDFVSTQTKALHNSCEQSLWDQANLMNQAEAISASLSYFSAYDSIKTRLNSSSLSVATESFVPLLTKIDECMEYVEKHPEHKESALYLTRFKLCLSQALSSVKLYVTNLLRSASNAALAALQQDPKQGANNLDGNYTVLYGKFKSHAIRIKNVMVQIEQRMDHSPEYESVVSDCQQCFLQYRWQLLSSVISEAIQNLIQQHTKNPCTLFRAGCSLMIHVCHDEYQLFYEFFTQGKSNLDTLLENLCGILYEAFRPLIIQMTHIETLAEICNILKVEMLDEYVQKRNDELSSFEVIISPMLEDVQERLVYRTQAYISADIAGFSPSPGDLAYPEKLMIEIGSSESAEQGVSEKTDIKMAVVDLQAMWFPTVRRALVCLSKLYNCIAKPTFEGIAQEVLSVCIESLKSASHQIAAKKGSVDGHLFLIKHLLILREQISPFDVDFAVKEVALDFTKIRSAAYELLNNGKKLFNLDTNNAILEFIVEGVPQVTEYYVDSKKEVDSELKLVCEKFIGDVSDSFISPLILLLDKMDTYVKMVAEEEKEGKLLLKRQAFAKPDIIRKVVSETYMLLKSKLPSLLQSLSLYLANKDTEYILFKPVKAKVLRAYRQLNTVILEHYDRDEQQIIGCPSQEQVSLLMAFY